MDIRGFNMSNWKDRANSVKSSWKDRANLVREETSKTESGLRGLAQGASMGFIDEATGGLEALWEKAKGDPTTFGELYKTKRDESRANYEQAQKDNPLTYGAGQIGGAIGTAFVPGLGGANIAKLGALGAAQGLGASEADLTEGDVTGAARDVAIGGALGAGAGVAGNLISKGLSKAAPAVRNVFSKGANKLDEVAEALAVKATGATGNQASKFAPNAGRELLDQKLVKFGDTAYDIAERVGQRHQTAGKVIGESLEELENRGVKASVDDVVRSLESQVDELSKTPGNEKIVKQLKDQIDNLYNRGESNIGIKTAEEAKRNFQGQTNYFSDEAEKKATGRLANAFKNEVEKVATKADPQLAQKFIDEKNAFGLLSPIKEAAEKRAMQQAQSPFGGLTDIITGATMGPKGLASKYTIEQTGRRAASSGAIMVDKLADVLRMDPTAFGKFAKPLQEAAQRGGTSLAATNFVLQQTNPEYREIYSKMSGVKDE